MTIRFLLPNHHLLRFMPPATRLHHLSKHLPTHHYSNTHRMSSSSSSSSSSFSSHTPRRTETVHDIAAWLLTHLKSRNQTLAVAESLTAGLVMGTLTSVPGVSAVFRGGVVSYATPLKTSLLGVDSDLIEREGVVHGDVAAQMAAGARRIAAVEGDGGEADWGIGTTGVAGPDPQDGKPVGMVYIGVASRKGSKAFGPFMFPGEGERIREATVMEALARLREVVLEESPDGDGDSAAKDAK